MMTTLSNNRTIFEAQNCPTRGILLRFYPSHSFMQLPNSSQKRFQSTGAKVKYSKCCRISS
jgi:hypothetical protein